MYHDLVKYFINYPIDRIQLLMKKYNVDTFEQLVDKFINGYKKKSRMNNEIEEYLDSLDIDISKLGIILKKIVSRQNTRFITFCEFTRFDIKR